MFWLPSVFIISETVYACLFQKMFSKFDKDRSGALEKAEVAAAITSLGSYIKKSVKLFVT